MIPSRLGYEHQPISDFSACWPKYRPTTSTSEFGGTARPFSHSRMRKSTGVVVAVAITPRLPALLTLVIVSCADEVPATSRIAQIERKVSYVWSIVRH